jgi:hypothetical protein
MNARRIRPHYPPRWRPADAASRAFQLGHDTMKSMPQRERRPISLNGSEGRVRWYHHAVRRLPVSCLFSLVTLLLLYFAIWSVVALLRFLVHR